MKSLKCPWAKDTVDAADDTHTVRNESALQLHYRFAPSADRQALDQRC